MAVSNDGNVPLTNLALSTDVPFGTLTCGATTVQPGQSVPCSGTIPSQTAGTNQQVVITATATNLTNGTVTDSITAFYNVAPGGTGGGGGIGDPG